MHGVKPVGRADGEGEPPQGPLRPALRGCPASMTTFAREPSRESSMGRRCPRNMGLDARTGRGRSSRNPTNEKIAREPSARYGADALAC